MYAKTETIGFRADFSSGSPIYHVANVPGLLARNPTHLPIAAGAEDIDYSLASALFRLAEYGLDFPGIGNLVERENEHSLVERVRIYTTTHFVEGFNMHSEMSKVPLGITLQTINGILDYYEAMATDYSDELYLSDVSLRQCIYGREKWEGATNDGQSHVYFVDYDRYLNNLKQGVLQQPPRGPGFYGIRHLNGDLRTLAENFPEHSFAEVTSRLLFLTQRLGMAYRHLGSQPAA